MLVSQTVSSVVTNYLLDVQPGLYKVIAATTGANTDRYLHGPMGIHAHEDNAGTWQYMLPDALGSMRAEVNISGNVQAMRHFAPYGEPFGTQSTFDGVFGFVGEPVDQNGLMQMRARYYEPGVGRFFNQDPSRRERNLYEYGLSNPVMNVDPSGLCTMGIPCPTNERMYSGTAGVSSPSMLHPNYHTTANLNTGCGFLSDVDPGQLVTNVANTFAFNTQAAIMIASNPNRAFQIPGGKAAYALALGYLYYEAVAAASLAVGTGLLTKGLGLYPIVDFIDDAITIGQPAFTGDDSDVIWGLATSFMLFAPDLPLNYVASQVRLSISSDAPSIGGVVDNSPGLGGSRRGNLPRIGPGEFTLNPFDPRLRYTESAIYEYEVEEMVLEMGTGDYPDVFDPIRAVLMDDTNRLSVLDNNLLEAVRLSMLSEAPFSIFDYRASVYISNLSAADLERFRGRGGLFRQPTPPSTWGEAVGNVIERNNRSVMSVPRHINPFDYWHNVGRPNIRLYGTETRPYISGITQEFYDVYGDRLVDYQVYYE